MAMRVEMEAHQSQAGVKRLLEDGMARIKDQL
jgi:hypothetical protein